MNTDRCMSEKIRATVEPTRMIFLVVAVCLLLVGMSVTVWSAWEMSRLEYWNRWCVNSRDWHVQSLEECLVEKIESKWWIWIVFQIVGIVGSSIGVGMILLLVFFRLRIPISKTPA